MDLRPQNCLYFKLFDEKRKRVQLTYNMKLTAGFSAPSRWQMSEDVDDYIEYGLTRAEIHLHLVNGEIDLKQGDQLGGSLNPSTETTTTTSKETEDNRNTNYKVSTEVGLSDKGFSGKANPKGERSKQLKNKDHQSTATVLYLHNITGNLSDPSNPFWIFKGVGSHLDGSLVDSLLCVVKADKKSEFSYTTKSVVHIHDIEISYSPESRWRNVLKRLPFSGVGEQRIKKELVRAMSIISTSKEKEVT